MKLGRDTGSLTNYMASGTVGQPIPTVGMGATLLCWTDRHALTVIEVKGKTITLQYDVAIRIDTHGMSESQQYDFKRDPNGATIVARQRLDGPWKTASGSQIRLGERDEYYDYSF